MRSPKASQPLAPWCHIQCNVVNTWQTLSWGGLGDTIHQKRWIPLIPESADNFDFSAERLSRLHCLTVIYPKLCSVIAELIDKMKDFSTLCSQQKCPLTPNSCDFDDLRTFVANFCCENSHNLSADFFGLKSKISRHFYFLDA